MPIEVASRSHHRADAHLDAILSHTRQMLAVAQAGDWARLAALRGRHRALLDGLSAQASAGLAPNDAAVRLRQIQDANTHLMELVRCRHDELAKEIHGYGMGQRAVHAYRQCESVASV
jgi:hypothetical protein